MDDGKGSKPMPGLMAILMRGADKKGGRGATSASPALNPTVSPLPGSKGAGPDGDSDDAEASDPHLESAAQEVMDSLKGDDVAAATAALKTFVQMCQQDADASGGLE